MIGEFLYSLSAMEAASAPVLQRYRERVTLSAAAVTVEAIGTPVPADKFCLVLCCTAETVDGAGQTTSRLVVAINDEPRTFSCIVAHSFGSSANGSFLASQFSSVLVGPGERLVAAATFSSGVNPNQVTLDATGLYIPKGNLQLR